MAVTLRSANAQDIAELGRILLRLRHKIQKPSNDAAFERLMNRLFLPEIPAYAGPPSDL